MFSQQSKNLSCEFLFLVGRNLTGSMCSYQFPALNDFELELLINMVSSTFLVTCMQELVDYILPPKGISYRHPQCERGICASRSISGRLWLPCTETWLPSSPQLHNHCTCPRSFSQSFALVWSWTVLSSLVLAARLCKADSCEVIVQYQI